ncbi:hypothetical protein C8R45DRAFT_501193 [Mycena sanguinolenta]|nr:hypothetical protein C8R45DRAFT_501193 [Mycena sanguinolenta]
MVWTRRAYREKMEISRWLPNEVLVQIIQHSLKADQATLSRVSKLFRDLCLSVLYRDVEIKHSIYAPSFCLAIIENPSRADHIRSLVLNIRPYYRRTKIRRDLILASLKLMSKLDHLSVSGFVLDNCFGDRCALLEECSFPRLIDCDISVPRRGIWGSPPQNDPADLVAAFLARHPTLKRIRIQVDSLSSLDLGFRMVTSSPVRVSLPNLEYYEGEAAFIPAINANGLQQIRLIWRSKDENVDKIIARMSPMTNPDEPFVSSHVYLADTSPYQIVTSVSTHMPYTRTLRLRRYETSPFFSFPLVSFPCNISFECDRTSTAPGHDQPHHEMSSKVHGPCLSRNTSG